MRRMNSPTPWRTGRHVFRTIYDANNKLIGVMDTAEDAEMMVDAMNSQENLNALLKQKDELLRESCPHTVPRAVVGPGDEYCKRCSKHNPQAT